jgi:hypothetical protein
MMGELMSVPTDTLVDILFAILASEVELPATDATNIEQIRHELQKRDDERHWGVRTIN